MLEVNNFGIRAYGRGGVAIINDGGGGRTR